MTFLQKWDFEQITVVNSEIIGVARATIASVRPCITHLLEADQLKGCVQDLKISLNDSKKIPEDSPIIFKIFPRSPKNILVDALYLTMISLRNFVLCQGIH